MPELTRQGLEHILSKLYAGFERAHGGGVADSWSLYTQGIFKTLLDSILHEKQLNDQAYSDFKHGIKTCFLNRGCMGRYKQDLPSKLDAILNELEKTLNREINSAQACRLRR